MATYTIELDDIQSEKAEVLAAYFQMPVEELLREAAELGMEGKQILMDNQKADPLGKRDPHRGAEWRRLWQRVQNKI